METYVIIEGLVVMTVQILAEDTATLYRLVDHYLWPPSSG
jgi:hypothetical protein